MAGGADCSVRACDAASRKEPRNPTLSKDVSIETSFEGGFAVDALSGRDDGYIL
jgi:hypothetical protein